MTEETVTIPADLVGASASGAWSPEDLRSYARALCDCPAKHSAGAKVLDWLADQVEEQHPPRMDEPDEFGFMLTAGTVEHPEPRAWLAGEWAEDPLDGKRWWRDESADLVFFSDFVNPKPVQS